MLSKLCLIDLWSIYESFVSNQWFGPCFKLFQVTWLRHAVLKRFKMLLFLVKFKILYFHEDICKTCKYMFVLSCRCIYAILTSRCCWSTCFELIELRFLKGYSTFLEIVELHRFQMHSADFLIFRRISVTRLFLVSLTTIVYWLP